MVVDVTDVHPLTDFQRHTKEHLERLRQSGRPMLLTVNGRAAVVVQDAESYQKLLEMLDRWDAVNKIREGLKDVEEGRTTPVGEAFEEIRRKLGLTSERGE